MLRRGFLRSILAAATFGLAKPKPPEAKAVVYPKIEYLPGGWVKRTYLAASDDHEAIGRNRCPALWP